MLSVGLAASAGIYCALHRNRISTVLASRPLVFLGEISFSLYLTHMFIIRAIQPHLSPGLFAGWIALGACISVAYLTYLLIERRGIAAGKSVSRLMVRPTAASAKGRGSNARA
jgi:peptidoglycan/LPS O-acetylase OafA/YrhL